MKKSYQISIVTYIYALIWIFYLGIQELQQMLTLMCVKLSLYCLKICMAKESTVQLSSVQLLKGIRFRIIPASQ